MEEKKKNKGLIILIVVLVIMVLGLTGYIVYDKLVLKEKDNNSNNNIIEPEKKEDKPSEKEFDKIGRELKEYYASQISQENGKSWYDKDSTEDWIITDVIYLAHFKDNENKKYYNVMGKYKCKDGSSSCVYMEQTTEDQDGYNLFNVTVLYENGIIELDSGIASNFILGGFTEYTKDLVIINKDVREENLEESEFNKLTREFKEHYANKLLPGNNTKHFYEPESTEYWSIDKITYEGYYSDDTNKKYYSVEGKFECKNNTSDCVYFSQVDTTNGYNKFMLAFSYDNGKIEDMPYSSTVLGYEADKDFSTFVKVGKEVK